MTNYTDQQVLELRKHVNKIQADLQAQIHALGRVQETIEEKVSATIEKKFKREKMKMGVSNPNKDILANDGGGNLKKMLVMKADKVDIEKIYEIKSDKMDTDNMLDVQAMMQK